MQPVIRFVSTVTLVIAGIAAPLPAQSPVKTAEIAKRGLTAQDFPKVLPLVPNVYAYADVHVQGAITTNALIVTTTDGVVVVDGQGTVPQTERMVAEIRKLSDKPIRYVIIGSNHADHTGGNAAFPETATFISHPVAQAAFQRAASQPPRQGGPPDARRVVVPTETVADKRVLTVGGTEIQILFLGRGHTGGDLEVFLPRQNILWMSEVFFNRLYPSVGGNRSGRPIEWLETLKKAKAMNAGLYVPNHGFIDSPKVLNEEFDNFIRALDNLVTETRRLHAARTPVESVPRLINLGEFQYWYRAANNLPDAVRNIYGELDGTLR